MRKRASTASRNAKGLTIATNLPLSSNPYDRNSPRTFVLKDRDVLPKDKEAVSVTAPLKHSINEALLSANWRQTQRPHLDELDGRQVHSARLLQAHQWPKGVVQPDIDLSGSYGSRLPSDELYPQVDHSLISSAPPYKEDFELDMHETFGIKQRFGGRAVSGDYVDRSKIVLGGKSSVRLAPIQDDQESEFSPGHDLLQFDESSSSSHGSCERQHGVPKDRYRTAGSTLYPWGSMYEIKTATGLRPLDWTGMHSCVMDVVNEMSDDSEHDPKSQDVSAHPGKPIATTTQPGEAHEQGKNIAVMRNHAEECTKGLGFEAMLAKLRAAATKAAENESLQARNPEKSPFAEHAKVPRSTGGTSLSQEPRLERKACDVVATSKMSHLNPQATEFCQKSSAMPDQEVLQCGGVSAEDAPAAKDPAPTTEEYNSVLERMTQMEGLLRQLMATQTQAAQKEAAEAQVAHLSRQLDQLSRSYEQLVNQNARPAQHIPQSYPQAHQHTQGFIASNTFAPAAGVNVGPFLAVATPPGTGLNGVGAGNFAQPSTHHSAPCVNQGQMPHVNPVQMPTCSPHEQQIYAVPMAGVPYPQIVGFKPFGPKPIQKPKGPFRPGDPVQARKQQEYEAYLEFQRANKPNFHNECKLRQSKRAERIQKANAHSFNQEGTQNV